jgi:flagellar export protein FliJ
MATFRFRAQPALDLRRREHDSAQHALARADAERQRVRDRLDSAEQAIAAARRDADAADRQAGGSADREWYRFWIVRLDQERAALTVLLRSHDAAVAEARRACQQARQRQEALERFRDKAYGAHAAAESATERKTIDELATRRFAARRAVTEGV